VGLGGISHLKVLGQSLIILNSHKTAMEILDKRGAIHSGRPRFPLAEMYEHSFDISDGLMNSSGNQSGFRTGARLSGIWGRFPVASKDDVKIFRQG